MLSTIQLVFDRQNVASLSLLYIYFYDRCPGHSMALTAKTHHARYTESTYLRYFHIQLVRDNFHSVSLFTRNVTILNELLKDCFSHCFNFNLFQSGVSYYLCYISSLYATLSPSFTSPFSKLLYEYHIVLVWVNHIKKIPFVLTHIRTSITLMFVLLILVIIQEMSLTLSFHTLVRMLLSLTSAMFPKNFLFIEFSC